MPDMLPPEPYKRVGGKAKRSPYDVSDIKRLHNENHLSQTSPAKLFGVYRNSTWKALKT